MLQPDRTYSANKSYRFGFNGKENDTEVKGEGAQYDYGFRIYDPRIVKFLSVDPLMGGYPWYSPYQFAGNKFTIAIDLDGLEEFIVINYWRKNGTIAKTSIITLTNNDTKARQNMQMRIINKDGKLGAAAAKDKKVLVRNVSISDDQVNVKPDETKNNLSLREKEVFDHGKNVPITSDNGPANAPIAVQVKEGKNDLKSQKNDYDVTQYTVNEKSKSYGEHDADFGGQVLQAGKTFSMQPLAATVDGSAEPTWGLQEARVLANALASTDIKAITIQPSLIASGGTDQLIMANGKTQLQNFNASYQRYGALIEKLSGVRVTVLDANVQTAAPTTGPTMSVQTQ